MSEVIKTLFFVRKTRSNNNGKFPIYLRVTINGERFEATTGQFIEPARWSQKKGAIIGVGKDAKTINEMLEMFRMKAFDIQKKQFMIGRELTLVAFAEEWKGVKEKPRKLLEVFKYHNDQVKELVDIQYAPATYRRYLTSLDHTAKFIKEQYGVDDVTVNSIKYQFITDYEFWLKKVRKCNQNSTIKYLTNFKKIIHLCIKNGWLDKDPFIAFRMTKIDVDRPFLTSSELDVLANKTFFSDRLNQVRDIFLFSCYTGLAYVDTQKLTPLEISIGIDGEKWIFTKRQKTESSSRIPLLPQAELILEKYRNHPMCLNKNRVLPLLSNQKMNEYLHEISTICGINKRMTYHTARHTFATTITLTNGVPIETVSKMLGHKDLKTTQHYAKILDKKVSNDMQTLREKLSVSIDKKEVKLI